MAHEKLTGGLTPADGADPRTFPAIYNPLVDTVEALEQKRMQVEFSEEPPEDTSVLWVSLEETYGDVPEGGVAGSLLGKLTAEDGSTGWLELQAPLQFDPDTESIYIDSSQLDVVTSINGSNGDLTLNAAAVGAIATINGKSGQTVMLVASDVGAIATINGKSGPHVAITHNDVNAVRYINGLEGGHIVLTASDVGAAEAAHNHDDDYADIDHDHYDYLDKSVTEITNLGSITGSVDVDFAGTGYRMLDATGDINFATSNISPGVTITLKIEAGASNRQLTFPEGWRFLSEKPSELTANQAGVLSVTAFGTADADCIAAWAETEPAE